MILGIGTDLCNIDRIEGTLERFGDRFRNRVFTETEIRKSRRRAGGETATLAKRWAAKEACSKALGTGLRMGIAWRDMAVSNLSTGQPVMTLSRWAADRLATMTPAGHEALVHVSLTDDHPWAHAFVVIEAIPKDGEQPLPNLFRQSPDARVAVSRELAAARPRARVDIAPATFHLDPAPSSETVKWRRRTGTHSSKP